MALRRWLVVGFVGFVAVAGCTGYRPVPTTTSPDVAQLFVRQGDKVRITVRGGERFETTVVKIQTDGIVVKIQTDGIAVGGERVVPYGDMTRIERYGFDAGQTRTLAIVAGGFFAWLIWVVSQMPVLGA